MERCPIYQCGDMTYTKQYAKRVADGQWFTRITAFGHTRSHFGKWTPCLDKPDYAWYNSYAGNARLPNVEVTK